MYKSQVELEEEMLMTGAQRSRQILNTNNEKGRASLNPTSKGIFKQYVKPLSEVITKDKNPEKYKTKDFLRILIGCEDIVFAYLAVREVLSTLVQSSEVNNARDLSRNVGKVIQAEMIFNQYEQANAKEYLRMIKQFNDNHNFDISYKTSLVKENLKRIGKSPIQLGIRNQEKIGAYLIENLVSLGMLEKSTYRIKAGKKYKTVCSITLSDNTVEYLKLSEHLFEEFQPLYMPLIEKPHDWKRGEIGGYHTEKMKAVFNSPFIGNYREGKEGLVLDAINALQSVKWKVNEKVLDAVIDCVKYVDFGEIVGSNKFSQPVFPTSIEGKKKSDMTEEEQVVFKKWKKATNEWHTENKRRIQRRSRMLMSINVANKFRKEKEFYFLYQADFRGRMYARSMGISPQGSDLQKSLITFGEGKKLNSPEAVRWFYIHGANKAGYDKATLDDRVEWVKKNHEAIIASAENPIDVDFWRELDSPFQFLAWAFEYNEFIKYGEKFFESHLPIGMDGSCNGLQNYSAGFRDIVGAESTNIVPSVKPKDIYQDVADEVTRILKNQKEDDKKFRSRWLNHGIKRSLVKRSVMTLPYGSTFFACKEFILNDYVKDVKPKEFEKEEWKKASEFLAKFVWQAIGNIVIKAREGMKWLQDCAGIIIKNEKVIEWETPSGFFVQQDYKESEQSGNIRLALFRSSVRLYVSKKTPDVRRHRNGVAPNFIHSLDSSHMQAVALRCKAEGINSFAMVHDDFGTHAQDAERFNQIIREEFFKMYQVDWFEKFYDKYKHLGIPKPPAKGELDLSVVLNSTYFFC